MMKSAQLVRYGGLAAIGVGLLNLVALVLGEDRTPGAVWIAENLLTVAVLIAFYRYLRGDGKLWVLIGLITSLIGNAGLLFDYHDHYFGIEGSVFALGLVILMSVAWVSGKFPKWTLILLVVSCIVGVIGLAAGPESTHFYDDTNDRIFFCHLLDLDITNGLIPCKITTCGNRW